MRKFETVDEVKSVTAHEVINNIKRKGAECMTHKLQEFLSASEDFKKKSGALAQSIEINSVLLLDNSTEKAGQRNIALGKLCRQAAEAKEAGKIMEAAMQSLEKELAADKERQFQYQKEMQQAKGQEKGDGR